MSHEIHDERKKLAKHLIEAEDDFAHHWGLLQEAELAVLGAQDRLKERQEFFDKASWCLEQAKAAMFAALSPAPSEGDALGDVEIPEGFVKWDSGYCPFDIGTHLEVFTRKNGVWPVVIKPEAPLLWEHEGHDLDIIAYRVLPIEPAEYEDPTAVAIAAYIEAEQADYPDLTDEQDAAIESATAEYQSTDGAEIVSGEPWENIHGAAPHTLSIAASSQHAEESARAQDLAPLFPPEREQPATPEELMESGAINGEAYGLWRKLTKEPA